MVSTAAKSLFTGTSLEFRAGRLSGFVNEWKKLTSDVFILNMVQGAEIPITDTGDFSDISSSINQVQGNQTQNMDSELQKLLKIGVIEESISEPGEVISPVFLVKKSDGSHRMILNLKKFNENVAYEHFKMENLSTATQMVTEGCFMASVDLRHAYYSVPVKPPFRKYLKFKWKGRLYQYTCFANGLSNCPRYFTKLLKPVYAHLRSKGYLSTAFIDDCYLQGQTYEECAKNVQETVKLFQSLGFVIHSEKSVLSPCKKLKYLGFWLNSDSMTVTLPDDKKEKIKNVCLDLKKKKNVPIRQLAQAIGQLVAAFPAVLWGPLFYRKLERNKSLALREAKGNFDTTTMVSKEAEKELDWWIDNIQTSSHPLQIADPDIELRTDASSKGGWGAVCLSQSAGGRWSMSEREYHINVLELLAVEYALKSFDTLLLGKHVKVLSDNTCAVSYLRNMGGSRSSECNDVAHRIWFWAKARNIWLTATYIPGKENVEADAQSRNFNDRTEWALDKKIFHSITNTLFCPEIDLFASRLNCQLKPFVSWGPDPEAWAVDAFTLHWGNWLIYAFPPFSLLHRVLCKWKRDEADGLLVAPVWMTATWYPLMLKMLTTEPILLPKGSRVLQLPHDNSPHPLHKKLQLMVCSLSGKPSRSRVFREKLLKSCLPPGETQQSNSMHPSSPGGLFSVVDGATIPFKHL